MNIFLHELKQYRKSTFIWSLSLALLVIFFSLFFSGFAQDAEPIRELMSGFPQEVLDLIGMNPETFLSILGFYSFILTYALLVGGIQAMNLGLAMLSKESRDKTADFLLTKPVTRKQIVTSKILASLVSIVISNIVFIITSIIMIAIVHQEDYSGKILFMLMITLFFVQLFFLALGFILSVLIPKVKSVISITLPTVFAFFIVNMLSNVIGEETTRYISPFEYYNRENILSKGTYDFQFIILEVILVTLFILFTYSIYLKKDIHSI